VNLTAPPIAPRAATFVVLSFEGPDRYAMAGGLGMRARELSTALARAGYDTHLLFVGDPRAPGTERAAGGLVLHRWCQWISAYYPEGVYAGEEAKRYDFNESVPPFVVERIARPAIEAGRLVVVMAEEWQTAEAACRISDRLHAAGVRPRAILLWNANNTTGFDRIDWGRLGYVTTITTVSRYMKQRLWSRGLNPLVIPNGIPSRLLRPAEPPGAAMLRRSLRKPFVLTKIGRWDPDKRWLMAVDTVAELKRRGDDAVLVALGGVEPHRAEVLQHARDRGLGVHGLAVPEPTLADLAHAFESATPADVLDVRSFVPLPLLRALYRASDAVLANSGHEPFGLVGLEAMASGAVAVTGGTGEDYAVHLQNAIVLETAEPAELVWQLRFLKAHPAVAARLGRAARATARRFTWERVLDTLLEKVAYLASRQGALPRGDAAGGARPRPRRAPARAGAAHAA
jgi:glycosyltransferase involved in cell wall biosynthesis